MLRPLMVHHCRRYSVLCETEYGLRRVRDLCHCYSCCFYCQLRSSPISDREVMLLTEQQMEYQLTLRTFPVLTVSNVLSIRNFYIFS